MYDIGFIIAVYALGFIKAIYALGFIQFDGFIIGMIGFPIPPVMLEKPDMGIMNIMGFIIVIGFIIAIGFIIDDIGLF